MAAGLEDLGPVRAEDLRGDVRLRWAVERGLPSDLSVVFNVADHILAGAFGIRAETYEESLDLLLARGVISEATRRALAGSGGFRNVLVHGYVRVEVGRVADALANAPSTFRSFVADVRAWLEGGAGDGGGPRRG